MAAHANHQKIRIRKGDKVVVLSGKDKGKHGEVLRVLPTEARAVVGGVNLVKRHTKATQTSQGGIIEKEAAIHVSNLGIEDPRDGKATRIGFKVLEDGRKVRVAKRSGDVIDV
ncbi:50S ribosomal protein L24 [Zavarzinia sp.]|uniref:50S ribosomal protein L24 n=1 Tax=Zavarzinia sp. TaxID=2027920 RepID=UPI003BB677D4